MSPNLQADRDLPRPGLSESLELSAISAPLESLLVENERLGQEAHIEPKTRERLAGIAAETGEAIEREHAILSKMVHRRDQIRGEIVFMQQTIREIDREMEISAAGLPAAQSAYGESLRELAQLYAVRGWSEDQKKGEIAYLQPRLQRLSEKLQAAREAENGPEIARIEKKMASLEGLLLSALAGPSQDVKFNETLMPLFAVAMNPETNPIQQQIAWTEITLRMMAKEPVAKSDEVIDDDQQSDDASYAVGQLELAQNARDLFGPMSENVREFANGLAGWLRYNPRRNSVEDNELLQKLVLRRAFLERFLQSASSLPHARQEELRLEMQIYQREADVLDRSLRALGQVSKMASNVDPGAYERREELVSGIGRAEQDEERIQGEIAAQEKVVNLREYQSLSKALTVITHQIQENVVLLRQAGLEGLARQKELKTTLFNLDAAFAAVMHQLETMDSQKWIEAEEDPYPSNWGIQERLWTTGDERPTPSELMRQYHLAKIGTDSVSDAYIQTLRKLAWTGMSANALMENLQPYVIDPVTHRKRAIGGLADADNVHLPIIGPIKDFAMRHPVLARELAANLMHTFSILSSDGSWLSSAKAVLQRKTYEDMVSDATLGGKEHLYTTEVGHSLSPEVIAFLDLAEKAPYIANGIKGAMGASAAGNIAQRIASWIPGGSHPFFQGIAGALGGVGEVKAHKVAAAKMTRNQEVAANMIWAAMRATNEGKGLKGALSDALGYGLARQALQAAGGVFRSIHEEGAEGFAARTWDRYRSRWQKAPGKEAAKTVGVTSAGVIATGAGVVASGTLGTFALAGAAPALLIIGGGSLLGWAGLSGYRLVRDNFFKSEKERKQENVERLQRWTSKLPIAIQPALKENAVPHEAQDAAVGAIAQAVENLPDAVYEEALAQKGGEKKSDGSVLTDLEAQQKYLVAKIDEQVVALDRKRQMELAEKAKMIAAEAGAEVEDDELVRRFNALKESMHPSVVPLDSRREHVQQAQIKNSLAQIQDALPASELERDPVEDELYRRLEALKGRTVTPLDIQALGMEVEILKIRQIEENALQEGALRALWDPESPLEQELEARLVGLQLPNVPRRSVVDAARIDSEDDLQSRLNALRASSSTKHRRQAVALEEKDQ